jgi:hypothetical protein
VLPSLLASSALADIYLHFPRGTNNRLNEDTRVLTSILTFNYFERMADEQTAIVFSTLKTAALAATTSAT